MVKGKMVGKGRTKEEKVIKPANKVSLMAFATMIRPYAVHEVIVGKNASTTLALKITRVKHGSINRLRIKRKL